MIRLKIAVLKAVVNQHKQARLECCPPLQPDISLVFFLQRPAVVKQMEHVQYLADFQDLPRYVQLRAVQILRMHVMGNVRQRIEAGHRDFVNEIRVCTCLFLGFPSLKVHPHALLLPALLLPALLLPPLLLSALLLFLLLLPALLLPALLLPALLLPPLLLPLLLLPALLLPALLLPLLLLSALLLPALLLPALLLPLLLLSALLLPALLLPLLLQLGACCLQLDQVHSGPAASMWLCTRSSPQLSTDCVAL